MSESMTNSSRSSHIRQRLPRRDGSGSRGVVGTGAAPRRASSMGRPSLTSRPRSRRNLSGSLQRSSSSGRRGFDMSDSSRDAFGDDIFDLDPSADYSMDNSIFTFDEAFPSDGSSQDFSEPKEIKEIKPRPPMRRNLSRREGMVKSSSRRSVLASSRSLHSSLRNINATLEF
jgi:hypothetical protein